MLLQFELKTKPLHSLSLSLSLLHSTYPTLKTVTCRKSAVQFPVLSSRYSELAIFSQENQIQTQGLPITPDLTQIFFLYLRLTLTTFHFLYHASQIT